MRKITIIMLLSSCVFLASGCAGASKTPDDDFLSEIKAETQLVCDDWDQVVSENMQIIQDIATSQTTLDYMKAPDDENLKASELDYIGNYEDNSNIALTGVDGMQVLNEDGDLKDVSDREYFNRAIQGESYVSDVIISKASGNCKVVFSAPIKDGETILGIVQKDYDLFEFHKILADYEEAFLVDNAGYMAVNSRYEITADNTEDLNSSEFMTSGQDDGYYSVDTGKGEKIVYYLTSPLSGWKICVTHDAKSGGLSIFK